MLTPYYVDEHVTLHHADCLDVLRSLPDCSVDSVVCDPPYALGFMGREWDTFGMDVGRGAQARSQRRAEVTPTGEGHSTSAGPYLASGVDSLRAAGLPFQRWCEAWATECLRVLKPGGHLLAFGGTRTWHRLACAVEDAGFEVRDSIAWMYGSGFPKSLDVSKAIDKAAGAEREASGVRGNTQCGYLDRGEQCPGHDDAGQSMSGATVHRLPTAPATDAAREWEGWGTALKPAFEPVVVARKPLIGTVAANVLAHGTGALNIDATRINGEDAPEGRLRHGGGSAVSASMWALNPDVRPASPAGRWPANVVLDESQAAALDEQSGTLTSGILSSHHKRAPKDAGILGAYGSAEGERGFGDSGGASRFFPVFRYESKANSAERPKVDGVAHPTVKPLDLMRWLVRLVTPPGGVVLDPFAGSGTTAEACVIEGFRCILVEREADYLPLIVSRLTKPLEPVLDFTTGGAA